MKLSDKLYDSAITNRISLNLILYARKKIVKLLENKITLQQNIISDFGTSISESGFSNPILTLNKDLYRELVFQGIGFPETINSIEKNAFCNSYVQIPVINSESICLPFKNDVFDITFSNAVFEHIAKEFQTRTLDELVRISRKVLIVVPNKYFPIEHHTKLPFLHYFESLFRFILKFFNHYGAQEQYLNFLTLKKFKEWISTLKRLKCIKIIETGYTGINLSIFSSNIYLYIEKNVEIKS